MSAVAWQYAAVILIVAAAAGYLARVMWKSARAKSGGGCHGGCACPSAKKPAPPARP